MINDQHAIGRSDLALPENPNRLDRSLSLLCVEVFHNLSACKLLSDSFFCQGEFKFPIAATDIVGDDSPAVAPSRIFWKNPSAPGAPSGCLKEER
jgi:hypothetical protein